MSIKAHFLAELKREAGSTRRMLERVPIDKLAWRPHEKSNSLEQLAKHIANLPTSLYSVMATEGRDVMNSGVPPLPPITSKEQLMELFETTLAKATTALENVSDEALGENWVLRAGDRVLISATKENAARTAYFNHLVHHRGQLSVYLRLLDVPVPGMYGPTADEKL